MNYKGNLMAVVLLLTPLTAYAQPSVTATGTGINKKLAQENSWIAAHFACNKKGFWADLDTVEIVDTDLSSYTIAGGRKKINQYKVNVSATCGKYYQRYPSDQQPSD
jgi:hypothetical protein